MREAALAGLVLLLFIRADVVSAQSTTPTFASSGLALAPGQFAVGAEALIWWFKDSPAPGPVVTDGFAGRPETQTFLGGQDFTTGANPGLRLTGGYALTDRSGLEGGVFYIPRRSTSSSVSSSGLLGSTDLVISYIDAVSKAETGTELSLSPIYAGSAREELSTSLLGAELNGVWALAPAGGSRVDVLAGLRYLRLRETYTLTTSSPYIPPYPQDIWNTTDEFDTTNNFYGAQVGVRARLDEGPFFAGGTVKVALGAMVQAVDISGSLVTNDFTNYGPTVTYPGGYRALPTNIGSTSRTAFAVVPEVGVSAGYRVTPSASVVVGYSFLYASSVVRPGSQVSRTVNPTQSTSYTENPAPRLQGPAQPTFQFNDSSFWAQGFSLGLAVRF